MIFRKAHLASACLLLALLMAACGKPAPEAPKNATPAKPAAADPSVAATEMDAASAVVRILNAAHRSGSVILRGPCAPSEGDPYPMRPPVTLEPMDKALQEISGQHQNVYWRESPASGIRVVDSTVQAKLLRVRVREFRIVEDREPEVVMAVLWRAPEVAAFLRKNRVRFARRTGTAKKAISPPMIVEVKNATVADILDRIAAGYRASPPRVWTYRECVEKKEIVIDVQMK
ncbi:MAG TPA: hypothetical protein VFF39_01605 [Verrucomicrobiae bacterium]|nr:hypothetical protein [Verrucomicrobiae bacterium]